MMTKNILVFSNGEKIGDGLIKLPLLYEIKKRLPKHRLIWMTNKGSTVYNNQLKNIAAQYIDEIIEKADLNPFFWQPISKRYNFKNQYFNYIFDSQKAVYRTIALKRINCDEFISASVNGFFSTKKYQGTKGLRRYYLDDLFSLLNLIKFDEIDINFKINIPIHLEKKMINIFDRKYKYIGIAPGAGEKNKIWPLEKFIEIGKFYKKKDYKIVLYLGPNEKHLFELFKLEFPDALFPEEIVKGYSNIEIVMASTKFLSCALANDSGISHMLSTKYCPLIKLFGPKNSLKFTPIHKYLKSISSEEFNGKDISLIPVEKVIYEINKNLS